MNTARLKEKDCLKKIVNLTSQNVILGPLMINYYNKNELTFGIFDLKYPNIIYNKYDKKLKKINIIEYLTPFNFILLPQKVIKRIGFLDENYFIYGEEYDYIVRALINNFKIRTITNSLAYCLSKKNKPLKIKLFKKIFHLQNYDENKFYFYIRNELIHNAKFSEIVNKSKKKKLINNYYYPNKHNRFIFPIIYLFFLFLILIYNKKFKIKYITAIIKAYFNLIIFYFKKSKFKIFLNSN